MGQELYNAELLESHGWPVLKPTAVSKAPGSQCILYPWHSSATVYSYVIQQEKQFLKGKKYTEDISDFLSAFSSSIKRISTCMIDSIQTAPQSEQTSASIHQLFAHRLVSKSGSSSRFQEFYDNNFCKNLFTKKWSINGRQYPSVLNTLWEESAVLLEESASAQDPTVVAHGDEHFANQFYDGRNITLFDPAFAGRMPALLAPVKATAHNVFLHPLWYYETQDLNIKDALSAYEMSEDRISITHSWSLKDRSPIRLDILQAYVNLLW